MKDKLFKWYHHAIERVPLEAIVTALIVTCLSYFGVNRVDWYLGEWVHITFRILFGTASLLLVLSVSGKVFKAVLVGIYAATFLINRTHYDLFGVRISMGGFYSLFETDRREATEFFSLIPTISLWAVPIFTIIVAVLLYRIDGKRISTHFMIWVWMGLMIIPLGVALTSKGIRFDMVHNPITTVSRVYKGVPVIGEGLLTASYYHEKAGFAELNSTTQPPFLVADSSGVAAELVVLVIGESSTRHHYSLYGYDVKTTPYLDEQALSNPHFVALTNAVSPSPITRESLKRALTFATVEDAAPYKAWWNVVDMANQAGYYTSWISNQAPVGAFDTVVGAIAHLADEQAFISHEVGGDKMDIVLADRFEELLRDRPTGKMFVVLHMIGSHYQYSARSEDVDKAVIEGLGSDSPDYDATILHTDRMLKKVLETAESDARTSALIYFSDHGEEVAGGAHGFPQLSKVQVDVPFIVWHDSTYADSGRISRIRAHKDDLYPIEDASYLLADFLGWSVQDRQNHLISSDSYEPRIPHIYNVDGEITEYQIALPHSVAKDPIRK